jgi:hypothetical protein
MRHKSDPGEKNLKASVARFAKILPLVKFKMAIEVFNMSQLESI